VSTYTMPQVDVSQLVAANAKLAQERDAAREAVATKEAELEAARLRADKVEREANVLYHLLQQANSMANQTLTQTNRHMVRVHALRRERFGV